MANAAELLELAGDCARRAGALLLERFQGPAAGVATKSTPTDLVSDADRDTEKLVLDMIANARPGDGWIGEEGGGRESSSGIRWIIDPLDGTVNFLYGMPDWAVSIAAEDASGAVVGVVFDACRRETFTAIRGEGAFMNGRQIGVTDETDLSRSLVATGFSYDAIIRESQAEVVRRILPRIRDIRRAGSAALDLCWVASGRTDAYYESNMGVWDRAAGVLIAREAGATVTDLHPPSGDDVGVIAANKTLHDQLRKLVGES